MVSIKNSTAIEKMRDSNRIIGLLFNELESSVKPGVSTLELDRIAEQFIRDHGAKPAFKGYSIPGLSPFPGAICASVNNCIVHGIPRKDMILKEGDIIGIDVGTYKNGYYGDAARTYQVGDISKEAQKLMETTQEALRRGISQAREGARVGDISFAIGSYVKECGYYVADNLTGHGIGQHLHEDPMISNMGRSGKGMRLHKGMTIAVEPMVNIGTNHVLEKGWEYFVEDGSLSAHFEHTILITDAEPELLTKVS